MPTNFKNKIRCDELQQKLEIFLANLQIKLDNREASLYCLQSQHHSLINILTKYSIVTNCK